MQGGLELAAVVVLVRDHDLVVAPAEQGGVRGQHGEQDLAFVGFGAGQGEPDRESVQGGNQVQAQTPEVARVAGAVAVLA